MRLSEFASLSRETTFEEALKSVNDENIKCDSLLQVREMISILLAISFMSFTGAEFVKLLGINFPDVESEVINAFLYR